MSLEISLEPGEEGREEGRREVVKRGEVGSLSELGREKAALSLRRREGTERRGRQASRRLYFPAECTLGELPDMMSAYERRGVMEKQM